jgi:hypothetical protein
MPVVYRSKTFYQRGVQLAKPINYRILLQITFLQPLNVSLVFVDIGRIT